MWHHGHFFSEIIPQVYGFCAHSLQEFVSLLPETIYYHTIMRVWHYVYGITVEDVLGHSNI